MLGRSLLLTPPWPAPGHQPPGPHAAQRDGVELCGLWPDVLLLQGENGYLWTVAFSVSHPPPELSR